jgi:hypothetical protein
MNTHFLPDIDFKNIINDETLSEIIWKYLQLILFTVIGTIKEKDEFGDYEKMFADVNSEELQENQRNHIEHDGFFGSAADDATATATDEPDATPTANASYIPNRRVERPSIGAVSG